MLEQLERQVHRPALGDDDRKRPSTRRSARPGRRVTRSRRRVRAVPRRTGEESVQRGEGSGEGRLLRSGRQVHAAGPAVPTAAADGPPAAQDESSLRAINRLPGRLRGQASELARKFRASPRPRSSESPGLTGELDAQFAELLLAPPTRRPSSCWPRRRPRHIRSRSTIRWSGPGLRPRDRLVARAGRGRAGPSPDRAARAVHSRGDGRTAAGQDRDQASSAVNASSRASWRSRWRP